MVITWGAVIGAVELAVILLWIVVPWFAGALIRHPVERLWNSSPVFHLCGLVVILLCWLLSFDVRFRSDWCYQPKFVLGFGVLLLTGYLLLFLPRRRSPEPEEEAPPVAKKAGLWSRYWKIGALTEPKSAGRSSGTSPCG